MEYCINEAKFEFPEEFTDQSVNFLTCTFNENSLPVIVLITRRKIQDEKELQSIVEKSIINKNKTCEGFNLLWKRNYTLNGKKAFICASHISGSGDVTEKRNIFIFHKKLLEIEFSVNGRFDKYHFEFMDNFIKKFRFR